jgi:predicted RNA-binding protein Jag
LPTVDDEELAMREAEEAVYQVMLHHKSIELSPQSSYVRRLQHQIVEKYHLQSRSTGIEPNRRVRVYKEAAQ